MMTIYHRAADHGDLRALSRGRGSLWRNLATVSLPVAVLAFGVAYLMWRSELLAGGIAAGLFVASLLSNIAFFRKIKRREALKADAKAVEVLDVSASRILDIEAVGDNAPALCFFVGDGKALLLVGQWLLDYPSFPSASFRVHRWADTKKPIRIDVIGPLLNPEHSTIRLGPHHRFGKIEVFDATPETLQDDLDRVFMSGRRVGAPG